MRQYISILPCVTACTESFMIAHTRAHQFIGFKRLFLLFHIDRELKWMILKWTYIIYCCPNIACQGFKKDQNQVKTNIPRVTNEGWNSQKQLSGPVEQKKKAEKSLQDLYLHPKLSPGLVPYWLLQSGHSM